MSYDSVVAADTPQAWWKLADSSGSSTAADSSGGGHPGTPAGVTFGQSSTPVAGNTTALFSGSSSGITTSYNPAGYTAVTLEAWVNLNGSGGSDSGARLLANDHTDSNSLGFQLVPVDNSVAAGKPVAYIGNGTTNNAAAGSAALPASGWSYLVATWNGTTITLYVNAVSVGTAPLSGTMGTGGFGTNIGNDPAFAGFDFAGLAAECAIYNYALTPAKVTAHYNAAKGAPGMLMAGIT